MILDDIKYGLKMSKIESAFLSLKNNLLVSLERYDRLKQCIDKMELSNVLGDEAETAKLKTSLALQRVDHVLDSINEGDDKYLAAQMEQALIDTTELYNYTRKLNVKLKAVSELIELDFENIGL